MLEKILTTNWLKTKKLRFWFSALEPLRNTNASILEVGAFEGRSAITFLEALPRSRVTTVDLFDEPEIEARCRSNLAPYGDRVEIIKMRAVAALEMLSDRKFDVIYLDAEKARAGTFAHTALAWPLLKIGGIMIWDDLKWEGAVPPDQRPGCAITLFCSAFKSCLSILHEDSQLIAQKIKEWP